MSSVKEVSISFAVDRVIWQNEDGSKKGKRQTKWKLVLANALVTDEFPEPIRASCPVGQIGSIKVSGEIPMPEYKGQMLDAYGVWEYRDNEYSFKAAYVSDHFPTNADEAIQYIRHAGMRISAKVATAIVEKFGYDLHEIAGKADEIAATIKGISYKGACALAERISQTEAVVTLMEELRGADIDYNAIVKIVRKYGPNALVIVHENPFQLWRLVGFVTCDKIHLAFGRDVMDVSRISAALKSQYSACKSKNAAILAQQTMLIQFACDLLNREGVPGVPRQKVQEVYDRMLKAYAFVRQGDYVYSKDDFIAERDLARALFRLNNTTHSGKEVEDFKAALADWSERGVSLVGQQIDAVRAVADKTISVLTGGPGTGKTTTLRAIIDCYRSAYPDSPVVLMAPTGLAAKRMTDMTGRPANTIHKALGLVPSENNSGFAQEGIGADLNGLIVMDESSMTGIHLAGFLMNSVIYTPATRIVFVGDIDQLPPVSQGAFFEDIIGSGIIPVTRLERNFRQEAGSTIIDAAYAIKNGKPDDLRYTDDFSLVPCNTAEIADNIVKCFKEGVSKYGLAQTFVLSPMHKAGDLCTNKLNPILQDIVNPMTPGKVFIKHGAIEFREGDRVICTVNDKDVVNGDIGHIVRIGEGNSGAVEMLVRFDFGEVSFTKDKLDMLELAYAISIHKSQGCEFDCIIMPATFTQSVLLLRNVLYTAVTRAKKKVWVVGDKAAVAKAIRTPPPQVVKSLLTIRMKKYEHDRVEGKQLA